MVVNWIRSFLQGWKDITRILEETLVDNISATVPWLAPVLPAYLIYSNMKNYLGIPEWVCFVISGAVEFLGLSTISTAFNLWEYGDSKKEDAKKVRVPFWVIILMTISYVVIIVTVNVILDVGKSPTAHIVAKALLSTISITGAVTLAIRSQHSRRLATQKTENAKNDEKESYAMELEKERIQKEYELEKFRIEKVEERKTIVARDKLSSRSNVQKTHQSSNETYVQKDETYVESFVSDWRKLPDEDKSLISTMTTSEIEAKYGVPYRTALNWYKRSRSSNGNNNGHSLIELDN